VDDKVSLIDKHEPRSLQHLLLLGYKMDKKDYEKANDICFIHVKEHYTNV